MDLSELAKWTIRPRLMAVPGVANVAIWGQRDRQFQVLVDPERLRAVGVTLDAVNKAVADAVAVAGGGFVDTPNQRIAVRHRSAIETTSDLRNAVVAFRNGAPLRLGEVAEVRIGNPPPIGDAVINDAPGLLLIVEKQPQGNSLDVTRHVEKALDGLALDGQGGRDRPDHLPPRDLHRAVDRQPGPRHARRLRPGDRDPRRLPLRLADGADQPDGDPALAGRRRGGPPR